MTDDKFPIAMVLGSLSKTLNCLKMWSEKLSIDVNDNT